MEVYYVTLLKNSESIKREGIRISQDGLDGPGVYVFKGPLAFALKQADLSLSDCHCDMTREEYDNYLRTLCVFSAEISDDSNISVEYPGDMVLRDAIPADSVKLIGNMFALVENCYRRSCNDHGGDKLNKMSLL